MANLVEAKSAEEFESFLSKAGKSLAVVHFQAAWAPQCGQMNDVMAELAKEHAHVTFIKLEAESFPEISEKYEISSVPTFILLQQGAQVERVDGAHAQQLSQKVSLLSSAGAAGKEGVSESGLQVRLKKLINSAPCMLFMKGTPNEPRCGFSKQIIALLKEKNIQFSSFDILQDPEVREGLKTFSNWPTYPQLYVNGDLLGGLDIVKEMAASGELETTCPKAETLQQRLQTLIRRSPVMVFMKGSKEEGARCGFSKQILEILNASQVDFESFDILQDEEVRQGLKTLSNWPTYPQLYVNGELIGGLDIVKELKESGELEAVLKGGS